MATVSGVEVELISKIGEVTASSIKYISGIDTREIPGWPSGPTSCDDMSLSYGEFPGEACSASASFYSFDTENSLLYTFGSCGWDYAPEVFYVDEGMIYRWHTVGRDLVWEFIGPCP